MGEGGKTETMVRECYTGDRIGVGTLNARNNYVMSNFVNHGV